jgi:RNA polymerase sigma factor (sigma-70 family)
MARDDDIPGLDDLAGLVDLVGAAQRGDTAALDRLLSTLAPYLGRLCGAIALDDGDDALQETMLAIVKGLGTLREPAAVRGWARRIAIRESVRVASGTARFAVPVAPEHLVVTATVPDQATELEVRRILAQLAPEHRAVLVLRHLEDLSVEETAAALGVPAGTVKSRLSRARRAFRARWIP